MGSHIQFGVSLFLLVAAALMAGLAWWTKRLDTKNLALWTASANWTKAEALIESAQAHAHKHETTSSSGDDNSGGDVTITYTYEPRVTYSFTSATQHYTGKRIAFITRQYGTAAEALSKIEQYRPGSVSDVLFDPANPANSVLDRSQMPSKTSTGTMILRGLAALAAIAAVVVWIKQS